jgi:hypothetical protein
VKVVDCFDVQALCSSNVFEYVPVGASWSLRCVSSVSKERGQYLRALEQSDKEARNVQCNSVEQHDVAEPFVCSRRKDTFIVVSL